MRKIRVGKDISLSWRVKVNGESTDLSGLDISLYLCQPYGDRVLLQHSTENDVVTAVFLGKQQKSIGEYSLELWLNKGNEGQSVVDKISAFALVRNTELEDDASEDNIAVSEIVKLDGGTLDYFPSEVLCVVLP